MTILDFVRTTRANLVLLILGIIIGALLGVGYSLTQPKVYAASASGYVTIGSGGTIDVLSGSSAAKDRARSYSAFLRGCGENHSREKPQYGDDRQRYPRQCYRVH